MITGFTYDVTQGIDAVAAFKQGNFDYLPELTHSLALDELDNNFLVTQLHPSDTCIPFLTDETIEKLAEYNLRMHADKRGYPNFLKLFAAVEVKPDLKLFTSDAGCLAVRQAVIVPHTEIQGHIAGPNRKMLDLVYGDMKIRKEPKIIVVERAATLFGGYLIRPGQGVESMGTHAQTQTYTTRTLPFGTRRRFTDSTFIRHRARIEEIDVTFHGGTVPSMSKVALLR